VRWRSVVRERFSELLTHPRGRRVLGEIEMQVWFDIIRLPFVGP
jgi:hypothetical protein